MDFLTEENTKDIDIECITPELLRKLHSYCKEKENDEGVKDLDCLQGELWLEFIPVEDGKIKVHTSIVNPGTDETLYETTSDPLNPLKALTIQGEFLLKSLYFFSWEGE